MESVGLIQWLETSGQGSGLFDPVKLLKTETRVFGLSFGKKAGEVIKIPYLRDRSLPLVKLVSSIQVVENEILM